MSVSPERTASKLAYLTSYFEITQSLIGVAKLHMTAEQRHAIKVWDDALDDLTVDRWHELGVPLDQMGTRQMFVISDEAVERFRRATPTAGIPDTTQDGRA